MAKPRKNYSYGKRPLWQWIIFYLLIGGIIYALLYYSGILGVIGLGENNNTGSNETLETEYFE